jgi:NAD+ kinase
MKLVGFVVHPGRKAAATAADGLVAWLDARGVEARRFDDRWAGDEGELDAFVDGLDLVVSVGGDGTFLRAALVASRGGAPVVGVKVGRIGFLTEVEPEDAPEVLERVIDGSARIEERLAVVAEPAGGPLFEPQWALNEIMVEKLARHRIVRLAVFVDDVYVTTFSADAVIVATPTGSTAYSFSGGGPIVTPSVPCLIVTPVAAHMVFDRSLVLAAEERVTLEVVGDEAGLISADGRESLELPIGARVRIGRADQGARLVRRDDAPPFLARVREKFALPGDDGGSFGPARLDGTVS